MNPEQWRATTAAIEDSFGLKKSWGEMWVTRGKSSSSKAGQRALGELGAAGGPTRGMLLLTLPKCERRFRIGLKQQQQQLGQKLPPDMHKLQAPPAPIHKLFIKVQENVLAKIVEELNLGILKLCSSPE